MKEAPETQGWRNRRAYVRPRDEKLSSWPLPSDGSEPDRRLNSQAAGLAHVSHLGPHSFPRTMVHGHPASLFAGLPWLPVCLLPGTPSLRVVTPRFPGDNYTRSHHRGRPGTRPCMRKPDHHLDGSSIRTGLLTPARVREPQPNAPAGQGKSAALPGPATAGSTRGT